MPSRRRRFAPDTTWPVKRSPAPQDTFERGKRGRWPALLHEGSTDGLGTIFAKRAFFPEMPAQFKYAILQFRRHAMYMVGGAGRVIQADAVQTFSFGALNPSGHERVMDIEGSRHLSKRRSTTNGRDDEFTLLDRGFLGS